MSTGEPVASRETPPNLDGQPYSSDAAIDLIDSTKPNDAPSGARSRSQSPGWKKLAKTATKGSLRESMNRRKYAKWNQGQLDTSATADTPAEPEDPDSQTENTDAGRPAINPADSSEVLDFAQPQGSRRRTKKERRKAAPSNKNKESAIDVLYENQRGWFFCGIPLYSHSSLLQFDPAPWVTKDYRTSAVNITNAQVPDPSWQWDWKHWYVDMSGDVDEDGWQYSFAFFGKFAWHGTHPWFHSYVRRRRWLRKRVKKASMQSGQAQPSSMSAAHKLNADYFTIHSKSAGAARPFDEMSQIARPESYVSYQSAATLEEEVPEDLKDIASLLKAIKLASIDREKLDAIKRFLDEGGEELYYLRERMSEIVSFFMFQSSKRQLLDILKAKIDEDQTHKDDDSTTNAATKESSSRHIDYIRQAAEAVEQDLGGLENWTESETAPPVHDDEETEQGISLNTIFDKPASDSTPKVGLAGKIKGISDHAEVGHDHTEQIVHDIHADAGGTNGRLQDKGKAREELPKSQEEDEEDADQEPSRLHHDQVFIPDD